jgi:ankyrin repeat protein
LKSEKKLFKSLEQEELNDYFHNHCLRGDLEHVKYLLTSPELNTHADIHSLGEQGLRIACAEGHLDIVTYLLTSPELIEHANVQHSNNVALKCAGESNNLELIKYLIESPTLNYHCDINTEYFFENFCTSGNLKTIKYLTNPDSLGLISFENLHNGFIKSCQYGRLEVIQYFLSLTELKQYADRLFDNDRAFKTCVIHEQDSLIEYFIFEHNIQLTDKISNFILEHNRPDITALFHKRELNNNLSFSLLKKDIIGKHKL